MRPIAVTLRRDTVSAYAEIRDAVDRRWATFLHEAGFIPVYVPNHVPTAQWMLENLTLSGILLTGGGDLAKYGGKDPERDAVEKLLLEGAVEQGLPILGVCRGMQVIQNHFGVPLEKVTGHVAPKQTIQIEGRAHDVNSYHEWGTSESVPALRIWARSDDGVVKAVEHISLPLAGIMWHPERLAPFRREDTAFFRKHFA
jgi:putative glutamine amidotransferase